MDGWVQFFKQRILIMKDSELLIKELKRLFSLRNIVILTLTIIFLRDLFLVNYRGYQWKAGTGFSDKTLWDLIEIIVVPLTLAWVVVYLNRASRERELRIAEQAHKDDQQMSLDRNREATLQNYLAQMGKLLMDNGPVKIRAESEIRNVARAWTMTTVGILDGKRKGYLLQFLKEAGLIDRINTSIDLKGANLSNTNWVKGDLSSTNLRGVLFSGALLLEGNFQNADLSEANMSHSHLTNANFTSSILRDALFGESDLLNADFSDAILDGASFFATQVGLSSPITDDYNVWGTVSNSKVSMAQFKKARSLNGVILPDGRIYDPAIHTEIARLRKEAGLDQE
jgi:hypothetical protein